MPATFSDAAEVAGMARSYNGIPLRARNAALMRAYSGVLRSELGKP